MKAARHIIPFIFSACSLLAGIPGRAQTGRPVNMHTKVILPNRPVRFDSLTRIIARQADVGFAFNTSKIAPSRLLRLLPGEQTLETFLVQLHDKTGIRFKLIGSHIVLFDKKPINSDTKSSVSSISLTNAVTGSSLIADPVVIINNKKQEHRILPASKKSTAKKYQIKKATTELISGGTEKGRTDVSLKEEKPITGSIQSQFKQKYKSSTQAAFTVANSNTARLKKLSTLLNDTGILKKAVTKKAIAKVADSTASSANTGKQKPQKEHSGWFSYMIGGGISRSLELNNALNKNRNGWEINVKAGRFVAPKLELGVSVGYNKFSGDFFLDGSLTDSVIERIALIPVLAGLRYYPIQHLYLSFETGYIFPGYKEMYGNMAAVPAAGISYPLQNGNKVDLGIRYTYMGPRYSINSTGNTGAFSNSFLSARLSYGFGNNSYKKRDSRRK